MPRNFINWSCKLTLCQRERDGGGGQPPVRSEVRAQSNKVGRLWFLWVDAREYPGGLLRLDPAFAYAEPPSSWPLSWVECLSPAPGREWILECSIPGSKQRKKEEAVFWESREGSQTRKKGQSVQKSQAGVVRVSLGLVMEVYDVLPWFQGTDNYSDNCQQLFWGQVKYIFVRVPYSQPGF